MVKIFISVKTGIYLSGFPVNLGTRGVLPSSPDLAEGAADKVRALSSREWFFFGGVTRISLNHSRLSGIGNQTPDKPK
jgi:hypothetical protein